MDKLRDEVLQAQRARSDLLKWKLALVGVIGSVGLGLSGAAPTRHADLVLAVIPLTCLYVDLLCRHLSLRMIVIGTHLRKNAASADRQEQMWAEYERLANEVRGAPVRAFTLESWAVAASTVVLSAGVFAYAFAGTHNSTGAKLALAVSAGIGGVFTLVAEWLYRARCKRLAALVAST